MTGTLSVSLQNFNREESYLGDDSAFRQTDPYIRPYRYKRPRLRHTVYYYIEIATKDTKNSHPCNLCQGIK